VNYQVVSEELNAMHTVRGASKDCGYYSQSEPKSLIGRYTYMKMIKPNYLIPATEKHRGK